MALQLRSNYTQLNYHTHLPDSQRLILLDLETTGFSPYTNSIIELGALEVINDEITRTFHSLIRPPTPVPSFVSQLTGIRMEDLMDKPCAATVLQDFVTWIGPQEDVTLVGHNLNFDVAFLRMELDRLSPALSLPNRTFCTFTFIKSAFYGRKLDLKNACKVFSVPKSSSGGYHRALFDCEMTLKLLMTLKTWTFFADTAGLMIKKSTKKTESVS